MEKELAEQTAFETGGIPTPAGQENMAATDGIADAVEGIMDNIQASIAGDVPTSGKEEEPTVAPGMNMHDQLEKNASEEDIRRGDSTTVTRLYVDRTPND